MAHSEAVRAMVGDLHVSAFSELVGLSIEELSTTRVVGWFDVGAAHRQPDGIIHGGVYASVVEEIASYGAGIAASERGLGVVGVSNTTNFIRPMRDGRIDVVATALHQGRTQQLWDVRMTDSATGKLVAIGQLRAQNVERMPGSPAPVG